jgi:hypothetical protein
MGDGETWGQYLKRMTSRPGWTVARLARESNIHRGTIFGWIKEDTPSVNIDSVRAITMALGDDLENGLRAAGRVDTGDGKDPEIELIRTAHASGRISDAAVKRLVQHVLVRRAREERARLEDLDAMIQAAERSDNT